MNDEEINEIKQLIKELLTTDSIEIGNSKTGTIKCYVNFDKPVEAGKKLCNAIKLLKENRKEVLGE